jgi:hypothetical protein
VSKVKRKFVDGETFVRTWQESASEEEVTTKLEVSAMSASKRAADYRKRGVPLKTFPKPKVGRAIDYAALAKLAESLGGNGKQE